MTVTILPHWYTVPQAADKVGVSVSTLRRSIDRGDLRTRRIGRVLRILDEDLAQWMRSR